MVDSILNVPAQKVVLTFLLLFLDLVFNQLKSNHFRTPRMNANCHPFDMGDSFDHGTSILQTHLHESDGTKIDTRLLALGYRT